MIGSNYGNGQCPYCGMGHSGMCPRVKAIEFHVNGVTLKRVEFHEIRTAPPLGLAVYPSDAVAGKPLSEFGK